MIPVGELLPDFPDRENPGVLRAENVVPLLKAYGPVKKLIPDTKALNDRCRGAATISTLDSTLISFAGDATDLYERVGAEYFSRGSGYTLEDDQFWTFLSFNDFGFAIGGYETLQQFTEGSPGTFGDVTAQLDPPPQALYGAVVRDFIMTGNQVDNTREVAWCGLDNHEMWVDRDGDAASAQQAGRQTLQEGGDITQIVGGEYGLIFCEKAIYRANYQGSPLVFSFNNIAPDRGTSSPYSVAQVGHNVYYLDNDGFYLFNGSSSPTPIGSAKVNQSFLDDFDSRYQESVVSLVDKANTLVFWSYPSHTSDTAGVCDKIMAYNWTTGWFSGPINVYTEWLVNTTTDKVVSDNYPSLLCDDVEIKDVLSDADQFNTGRRPALGTFNKNHKHATPGVENYPAIVESGEVSLNPNGLALVQSVRGVVEGKSPAITMAVGSRNFTYGNLKWTAYIEPNPRTQIHNYRVNARYHRYGMVVRGDWDKIVGAEPLATPTGSQ